MAKFEEYYLHSQDSIYKIRTAAKKVSSIITELSELNDPNQIKKRVPICRERKSFNLGFIYTGFKFPVKQNKSP